MILENNLVKKKLSNRSMNILVDCNNNTKRAPLYNLRAWYITFRCIFRLFNLRYHCGADLLIDSESNDIVWL